jgi:hypothetical protein
MGLCSTTGRWAKGLAASATARHVPSGCYCWRDNPCMSPAPIRVTHPTGLIRPAVLIVRDPLNQAPKRLGDSKGRGLLVAYR